MSTTPEEGAATNAATTNNTNPTDMAQMLVYLRCKSDDKEVQETIMKVKAGNHYKDNLGALSGGGMTRPRLAKTLAYLTACGLEDESIARLSVPGLKALILSRLTALAPEICRSCTKTFYYEVQDLPAMTCGWCHKGACPNCYPTNMGQGRSVYYLCSENNCEEKVTSMMGEKALDPKLHLLNKPKVTKATKRKAHDESCVLTKDGEVVVVEEEGDDDEEEEEVEEEVGGAPEEGDQPGGEETDTATQVEGQEGTGGDATPQVAGQEGPGGEAAPRLEDQEFTNPRQRRGFLGGKGEPKDKPCRYLARGYCHYSLSGRKPYKGKEQCPFVHPKTCPKLLNNGSKGKFGCDKAKCDNFHPKMCPDSENLKQCLRDCRKGYHVRNNSKAMQVARKEEESKRRVQEEKMRKEQEERKNRRMQFQAGRLAEGPAAARGLDGQRPDFSRPPPPHLPAAPTNIPTPQPSPASAQPSAAFLEEVRRFMVQTMMSFLPAGGQGSGAPVLAPAMAPSLAPSQPNWAGVVRLNLQ